MFFQSTVHLIEQCPALSPSKRRPKVKDQVSQPSTADLQPSTVGLQGRQLSSGEPQVPQATMQTPTLQASLARLTEKMDPKQLSEIGELSSGIRAQAGISVPEKVSECAVLPTSECDQPGTTSCGGASHSSPGCLEDFPLSSAVELSNEGRLQPGTESQRIGKDQICEQIDKSPPKEEKRIDMN